MIVPPLQALQGGYGAPSDSYDLNQYDGRNSGTGNNGGQDGKEGKGGKGGKGGQGAKVGQEESGAESGAESGDLPAWCDPTSNMGAWLNFYPVGWVGLTFKIPYFICHS